MSVECKDLENILERQQAAELEALEAHAAGCARCRRQLDLDHEIAAAARSLRRDWESPGLWPRIARALEQEAGRKERHGAWDALLGWARVPAFNWRLAAGTVALVALVVVSTFVLTREPGPIPRADERRLLTDQALQRVEEAEAAYVKSIQELSTLAEPKLEKADSPLISNYREKLLVLDAAIAETRAQIETNPYNTHLRNELSAMYQAKKSTLDELLREK